MHDTEIAIDAALVTELVAEQFPELNDLPVREFGSTGTVNAIYRLGDELCVRLPRVEAWAQNLGVEWRWLPILGPQLSLRVPEPVNMGSPSGSYPFPWSIYRWIDGQPYADERVEDEIQSAEDLAQFILELRHGRPPSDAPRGGRRPLRELDAVTRAAIASIAGVVDSESATAAWDRSLEAAEMQGTPVWVHADLLRPNLLVDDGRLSAVIDFGSVGVGDPAADVIAAWSVFDQKGRDAFRSALAVDDDTWSRARGYALHQAALIIPYYVDTNPEFVSPGVRTIKEILSDSPSEPTGA